MTTTALDEYGNALGGVQQPLPIVARSEQREPFGRVCGLHDPDVKYYRYDIVAFNGSEWRARYDDPGPLPGDGWVLGAKGSRGKQGEKGRDGVHVRALDVVGYELVLRLSDGTSLRANLLPLLDRFVGPSSRRPGAGYVRSAVRDLTV